MKKYIVGLLIVCMLLLVACGQVANVDDTGDAGDSSDELAIEEGLGDLDNLDELGEEDVDFTDLDYLEE